ncbi:hypothetical protein DAPPUDRAFT_108347 [Daphnia pulex]|uniref:Uncharacterized protein n=1 Tax=Daphnia pulex TaxID=6669 RepID=E9GZX0_DAPPU|nr:hypothetical protein DAPPUDRAFT_108347 [Daphnia pulex]|eukprot:EFX74891.1 hypothetical protein DAPPUDRAFT_108347 [Daphnia pulex]
MKRLKSALFFILYDSRWIPTYPRVAALQSKRNFAALSQFLQSYHLGRAIRKRANGSWLCQCPSGDATLVLLFLAIYCYAYVVGGHDGGRDDATELSSAESCNPNTTHASPILAMSSRRSGVGLAVVNGQLYAVSRLKSTIRSRINGDCVSP